MIAFPAIYKPILQQHHVSQLKFRTRGKAGKPVIRQKIGCRPSTVETLSPANAVAGERIAHNGGAPFDQEADTTANRHITTWYWTCIGKARIQSRR